MEVGLLIKKMRENRNISREQMADWLSIAVNTYKKIEYGERAPSLQEIKTISEKLEFDPSLFFKSQGTTIVNNGDYSSGTGNIVINDKDIVMALTKSLDKLANALDKLK
jgi:transcriptional regulator with XRE-family HTH domain